MFIKKVLTLILLAYSVSSFSQSLNIPLVIVEGSSIIYTNPDELILNLTVTKKSNSLSEVRKMNANTTISIINFLKNRNIEAKNIQTQYLNIGPRVDHKTGKVMHFKATQNISVCLKNIKQYDEVVDGLIGLGVYSLGNPVFRTTRAKELKDKARKQAIIKAREKAALLAGELGQKIGKAKLITDIENAYVVERSYANLRSSSGAAENEDSSLAVGQLQIKAVVKVSFELL